jgi:hypothetical protein
MYVQFSNPRAHNGFILLLVVRELADSFPDLSPPIAHARFELLVRFCLLGQALPELFESLVDLEVPPMFRLPPRVPLAGGRLLGGIGLRDVRGRCRWFCWRLRLESIGDCFFGCPLGLGLFFLFSALFGRLCFLPFLLKPTPLFGGSSSGSCCPLGLLCLFPFGLLGPSYFLLSPLFGQCGLLLRTLLFFFQPPLLRLFSAYPF